jgi:hypothetical protein
MAFTEHDKKKQRNQRKELIVPNGICEYEENNKMTTAHKHRMKVSRITKQTLEYKTSVRRDPGCPKKMEKPGAHRRYFRTGN